MWLLGANGSNQWQIIMDIWASKTSKWTKQVSPCIPKIWLKNFTFLHYHPFIMWLPGTTSGNQGQTMIEFDWLRLPTTVNHMTLHNPMWPYVILHDLMWPSVNPTIPSMTTLCDHLQSQMILCDPQQLSTTLHDPLCPLLNISDWLRLPSPANQITRI